MFLPKSDVFKDLRRETIDAISSIAVEEHFDEGTLLYSQGDPASYLYILVEGKVSLKIGKSAEMSYLVEHLGETFGWPSVVGHGHYVTEARCLAPTKLLKIKGDGLEEVFETHERSGRKFYSRLAAALGTRLIEIHA
jgi:CRP-like cAMP-binding protein